KARENPPGYRLDLCYGDAADPDAIQTVSTLFAPCWGDPEAKANWREGVTLIKQLLKVHHLDLYDEYERPLVKTMLTVDPACKNTIKEFNSYRTKENLTHGEEHRA